MTACPARRRLFSSRGGFSLLELLIALAMSSMLMLALYTAMRVTAKSRDSAAAAVDPIRSASVAMDLIQQDFEAVPPPAPSDTSTNATSIDAPDSAMCARASTALAASST